MRKAPPKTAKLRTRLSLLPSEASLPSGEGGKNVLAIMSLKNPKRAKSYHSRTLPMTPAMVCAVLLVMLLLLVEDVPASCCEALVSLLLLLILLVKRSFSCKVGEEDNVEDEPIITSSLLSFASLACTYLH